MTRITTKYLRLSGMFLVILVVTIPTSSFSNSYRPFYTNWGITENIDEITDNRVLNLMTFASVDDQKGNLGGTLQILITKRIDASLYLNSEQQREIIVALRLILGLGTEKTLVVPFKMFDSKQPLLVRIDKEKAFIPSPVIGEGLINLSLAFLLNEENLIKLEKGKELRIQLNMNSGENLIARFKLSGFAEKINMLSENKKKDEQPVTMDWETGAVIKK
jgi:hypothetical protein